MTNAVPIVGNSAIRATGDTKTPAKIMVLAAFGNAVLDPLLIFGYWGFPEMGVRGAALASLLGWLFATIWALWILRKREHLLVFEKPTLSEVLQSWRSVLYIGIPAAATYSLSPVATALLIVLVAEHGTAAVAAYGVGVRIRPVAAIVALGLSSSLPVFVGQNIGAKLYSRVSESIKVSNKLIIGIQIIVALALMILAKPIAFAFSQEPEVRELITAYLRIVPLGFIGLGLAIIASSAFNAANKPMYAMVVNVVRLFVCLLPAAWIGSYYYGLIGLFWGSLIGYMLAGVFAAVWLRRDFSQLEQQASSKNTA